MKHAWALSLILSTANVAVANDTAVVGVGGSLQPLKGEHRDIQMVREWVRINIDRADSYTTTVDFDFYNHGAAQTVQMGFPESGMGDIRTEPYRKKGAFTNFRTWIDGRRVTAKRTVPSMSEGQYEALWVKSVPFKARQKRRVRVSYRSLIGARVGGGPEGVLSFASYSFTGQNWRDNVRSSTLTVTQAPSLPPLMIENSALNPKPDNARRTSRWARFYWTDWPAQGYFSADFARRHSEQQERDSGK
jgi:hypothetical protein